MATALEYLEEALEEAEAAARWYATDITPAASYGPRSSSRRLVQRRVNDMPKATSQWSRIAPAAGGAARQLTLDEWAALPEDEPGELCRGALVEEEVPDLVHEIVVAWLIRVFGPWIVPQGGLVGASGAKLGLREGQGRKPDVLVYLAAGPRPPRRGVVRVPPDIAVEVISPEPRDVRRDRVEKMEDYAAFGIRSYWIVDPDARTLEIFELGADGRYTRAIGATEGLVGDVPGCPGLTLDLSGLWAETDRLAEADASAASE